MRIAFGEHAGKAVRRIGHGLGDDGEPLLVRGPRCWSVNGFTIHANRYIGQQERTKLEELLAYGARGSFSHQRLALADPADSNGDLVYALKTPYFHTSRYIGVLASHSKWRRQIVPSPDVKRGYVRAEDGVGVLRMTWSRLLKRTFAIDLHRCLACAARVYPENFVVVDDPFMIAVTLRMLGVRTSAPARAPPRTGCLDNDFNQAPAIDASDVDQLSDWSD